MSSSDDSLESLREEHQRLRQELERHKEIERELQASENRFRIMAETLPVPMVIWRLSDERLVYSNMAVNESYGLKQEDMVGQPIRSFYADPAEHDVLLDKFSKHGKVRNHELRARLPDGRKIWLSTCWQSIDYQGEKCILSSAADFTHRKEIEEQLRHERRVLQRLLEVHERERQLVAYEIHDGIVQDMSGSLMFLEAARHALESGSQDTEADLQQAIRLLRESIKEARRLISGLRPPILEEAGVLPALHNLIDELLIAGQMEIEFIHDVHFDRLAPALEMAIYRIVQEGLNNAWQHSQTKRAQVVLRQLDHHIEIIIRDWGVGFDPSVTKKRRYGLTGVRERARLLGGGATIESAPERGTTIRVQLPLEDAFLPESEGKNEAR